MKRKLSQSESILEKEDNDAYSPLYHGGPCGYKSV